TAPDRVGDVESNRANLLLRYELTPYVYSLAHRAYLNGEPIFPSLAFYYPSDANVREMASEKLIGRDLLAAVVAKAGVRQQRVYLPAGDWVEYHTRQWHSSPGEWLEERPLYVDGLFRLPLYARAGAILPQMYVDERTLNIEGQRSDGTRRDELVVTVFASEQPGEFALYEDDGQSTDYQRGAVRTTVLSQETRAEQSRVRIATASGSYRGAVSRRDNVVRLVLNGQAASQVTVNGRALPQCGSEADWTATQVACWGNADANLVLARSGTMDVGQSKEFVFALTDAAQAELWHGPAELPSDTRLRTQPAIDLRLWLAVALLLAAGVVVSWRIAQRERSSGANGR
ncbi:MAG TPA: glycoside hydrolase family 31 protein, partial [Anaerolineae bacterium]|nr:glycoside hydrolase family 31 protein [Anaerolineae bacterium]